MSAPLWPLFGERRTLPHLSCLIFLKSVNDEQMSVGKNKKNKDDGDEEVITVETTTSAASRPEKGIANFSLKEVYSESYYKISKKKKKSRKEK